MNIYCNKYFKVRDKQIEEMVKKIENNEININELEDDLINNLICYYTKQICLKRKEVNNVRKKLMKGKI